MNDALDAFVLYTVCFKQKKFFHQCCLLYFGQWLMKQNLSLATLHLIVTAQERHVSFSGMVFGFGDKKKEKKLKHTVKN